jgi:catechol 2,3-dioxygenase-like lactoylglutathione lyase family enzyme
MSMIGIKETALYVKDLERTKHFYHDLLGFPLIGYVKDRHVFFRVGSCVLLCFNAETTKNDVLLPPHFAEGHQHIAFEVAKEEYDDWKKKILELGIAIIHEHQWSNDFKSFYFNDLDSHVLEIVPTGMWGY